MSSLGVGAAAVAPAAEPALEEAITRLAASVDHYWLGQLTALQFRAVRVPMGVYEQRQERVYMLRARCTGGVVLPEQLERLAEVAAVHGNGLLHVTTRQEIQVHGVKLLGIMPGIRALADVGLSTVGGGGNTVRNITCCADAGVCPEEALDVTPHAAAVASRLLADPRSLVLPRKYKIGFAGCARDCGGALVNDLAFVARIEDGVAGFAVYAGGGMGSRPRIGELLECFIPVAEAPLVAEAVKRVFDRHGNRKDRRHARLRFLVEQLGFPRFRDLYAAERASLGAAASAGVLGLPEPGARAERPAAGDEPAAVRQWRSRSVLPQRQAGYNRVIIPLPLGDLPADRARALADLALRFGDRRLRATQDQNLALRFVRDADLPALHTALEPLGLGAGQPPVLRDLVACAGASWCKLGLCRSRDLAVVVSERLAASGLDLDAAGAVKVGISGCPDACGRHPVAAIGLAGAARRVRGQLIPHYLVHLGGRLGEGRTRLANGAMAVPARDVPAFLEDLLRVYLASPERGDFDAFLQGGGRERALALAAAYRVGNSTAGVAFDWGAEEAFSLAGRGPGECGAGVFDLIEVDLASAEEALRGDRRFAATALAARALLVTRGEQPASDAEALQLFRREFLETGLVAGRFAALIADALGAAAGADPERAFPVPRAEAASFVATVRALYAGMDATLQFAPAPSVDAPPAAAPDASPAPAAVKDLRGVVCPLNYVKTKMALGPLRAGELLAVILDQQGAKNVPDSAAADGHQVLSITPEGDAFRVLLRKGAGRGAG